MKSGRLLISGIALFFIAASGQNRLTLQDKELFMSGLNLAWINFADDIGNTPLDENRMRKVIQDVRDAGGNALRWWLFTNASLTPEFDANGLVSGIGTNSVNNVKKALDIAEENGVVISLCLLSFDLMQSSQVGDWNHMSIANNKKMLTTDEGIKAFIDNAVIPLVKGIGDHPAIMTWEVFNEPEGMTTEFGWTPEKISMADVQKVTNRVAAAIHDNAPGIMVSSGTHSFHANSDVPTCSNCKNYYRDDRLIAAGGKENGTLDFYQVHYYPQHFDDDRNPFAHPASYWELDKPVVIGEFPAGDWINKAGLNGTYRSSMTNLDAVKYAYNNGYAGVMGWDCNGFADDINKSYTQDITTITPSLQWLYTEHKADVLIKEVTREDKSGNGVMQVTYADVNSETGASIERMKNYNLTGKTSISVDARVVSGDTPFTFRLVLKTGSNWDWRQTEKFCSVPAGNSWTTCEFDLSTFAAWDNPALKADLSSIRSIILQTFTNGYSGVVQFDNIRAGNIPIDSFSVEFDVWSVAGGMDGGDAVTEIKTVFVDRTAISLTPAVKAPENRFSLSVVDEKLYFPVNSTDAYSIQITNIRGQKIVSVNNRKALSGKVSISIRGFTPGVYFASVRVADGVRRGSFLVK